MINKYKKWDLIKRWEIDSTVFMIVISIMFVISLFLIEELREHEVYLGFSCLIWLMTIIQSVRFIIYYNKICNIVANQKIIRTKVIWVNGPSYQNLKCRLKSIYFDKESGNTYMFDYSGEMIRKLGYTYQFKQGEDEYDLKTIDVLVNKNNYNEYVVLFEEEINLIKK